MSKNVLDIQICEGKYRVFQQDGGKVFANRNGILWRDLTGDNLVLSLAQRIEELEEEVRIKGWSGG